MEVIYVILGIIVIVIIVAVIAIPGTRIPNRNDKCMNCGKAVPVNGVCPWCGYNERTQKLQS